MIRLLIEVGLFFFGLLLGWLVGSLEARLKQQKAVLSLLTANERARLRLLAHERRNGQGGPDAAA